MIINKSMVDGDNMIRLEGFLMPNSKQQLVRSGDSSSLFTSTVMPWQMTKDEVGADVRLQLLGNILKK